MAYGITNQSGKPSKSDVFKVLEFAWEKGVKRFDTAPGYGSEILLGEFSRANGLQGEMILLTKVSGLRDSQDYRAEICQSLDLSLDRLGSRIHTVFLHDANDSQLVLEDEVFFQELLKRYQVNDLGISVYETSEVEAVTACDLELAYQFPYNVLDRRFEGVKMTPGKRYARSIFLQGLLASPVCAERDLPGYLISFQKRYHEMIERLGLKPVELAFAIATQSEQIDYVLIGVENICQLTEILDCSTRPRLSCSELSSLLENSSELVTDPRRWS
jgi:aryl-alcohol dehydrogenase-like predicted oxidoreductase